MARLEELEKIILPQPAQTEKRLLVFFLWTSLVPLVLLFLAGYYTTITLLQKQAFSKQVALAEQKHGELALFVEKLQANTAAWSTDGRIRELAQKINDGSCSKIPKLTDCPTIQELSKYLAKNKIPLNPTVGIIDILSTEGIVIASSDTLRIGLDESEQKTSFHEAKMLPFGEATFFHELVSEEEEFNGRLMVHLSAPIASSDNKRLVGVLLAHTENKELNDVVAGDRGQTTESYLVNKDRLMVTPSRFVPNAIMSQRSDTLPVRECIEHNTSFSGSYPDYRGIEVFGAAVCDPDLFGTLLVETDKSEVFIEIDNLRNTATAILVVVLVLILLYAYLSGADLVRGARHLFPNTLSSMVTLSSVTSILVIATISISFFFAKNIEEFIITQKTTIISSLVRQQSIRHLDDSEVSVFTTWETPESQKKFEDFSKEILRSFHSVAALQLHSTSGVLVWSSLQNAKIGSSPESEDVTKAIHTGEIVLGASSSTVSELGISTLVEIYVPILGTNGEVIGIVEAYLDTGDVALFTGNIQTVLWVGSFASLVFIFLLLRFVFRRQDARIIAQSEELSGLIEQSPIGIYTVSKKGIIETMNHSMVHIFGAHEASELIGKNISEIKYGREAGLNSLIQEGLSGKTILEEFEISSTNISGNKTYHYYHGVPIRNIDGDIEHLLLMVEDITKRKELENQIHEYTKDLEETITKRTRDIEEAKIKAEALLASLGEGMIATDNDGKILTINLMAEKMLGWKKDELLGKIATDMIPALDDRGEIIPPQKRILMMAASKENTATLKGLAHLIKKNGEKVPVAKTATPVIIDGKNTGAVVVFRDITAENEIEKTRRDLLTLASHQLRTPLSGTKWLIETLKRGLQGPLTPGQTEYLDEIYKINERMTTLVHDMLGVLRMEGDITPAKNEPVSLATLFGIIFEQLGSAAKGKQTTLRLAKGNDYIIESDPFLLQHILESFISNAINYSPAGSEVVVNVEKTPSEYIFSVKDSGIGIPKDEQRQIFERFYRASNAKTYDTHGTGLGLYIAATLAKKIGAKLSFESEKDKGSTFYVHLPYSGKKD